MNVQAYLDCIRYRGPLAPSAETLRALQVAHLQTVPFENLSIHAGQPIVLNVDALFEKVVMRRRGGFCYELNGLFAALLRALGFEVDLLSAEVARADGTFSPDFDHMALAAHLAEERLAERRLVDVGFGDSFREPLRLAERGDQAQGDRAYRIEESGPYVVLLQRQGAEGVWEPPSIVPRCSRASSRSTPRCASTTRPRRSRTSRRSGSAPWPRPTVG